MKHDNMEEWQQSSVLDGGNALYLESLYEKYLQQPASIPVHWQQYFGELPIVSHNVTELPHGPIQIEFLHTAKSRYRQNDSSASDQQSKQTAVNALIQAYRLYGHLSATTDPLSPSPGLLLPELQPAYYGLSQDLETPFISLQGTAQTVTLNQLLLQLKTAYCGCIASEFMHILDEKERIWLQQQVESFIAPAIQNAFPEDEILDCLIAAEGLEKYLGSKYPGAKRFSLEGSDTLILALNKLVQEAGAQGTKEIVIGMAHRGRLNVLVNSLGKVPSQLFDEFEGKHAHELEDLASGDVKYHQGFSSDVQTAGGIVHLALAFNPSHLEIVSPVVEGSVRARQERRKDLSGETVLPIIIHGDAAFAGQGVVMETLNMSQTRGYRVGGTIHIIVNNQIGFTISNPEDARSTLYCCDVAKMIQAPIFHVNGDHPKAVFFIANLAQLYRKKFKKDIVIDLVSYRRHGHNEADEPAATQPLMYQNIRKKPTVLSLYSADLIQAGRLTSDELSRRTENYRQALTHSNTSVARHVVPNWRHEFMVDWKPYFSKDWREGPATAIDAMRLQALAQKKETLPAEWVLHPRVQKIIDDRKKMTQGLLPLDWGYAETLAYASLVTEGFPVRLSGQDCGRGTFFHRHAVLHNQKDGQQYLPLCHLSDDQANFSLYDSLLSEAAVMGFEYGYSATEPTTLVLWEAQFGDFANGAQVVIDQFISSGEQKWGRLSGLTLLLPHGYEGQGPEHSSARLERYLQLCAEHNIQVCVPSTPAQVFHMLRRQAIRPMRKPLVVMTPKSLLRHPLAVSSLNDLSTGTFQPIIGEIDALSPATVKRVVLCSGKVYYDLLEARRANKQSDVALIRVEQLYPFPEIELKNILQPYGLAKEIIWCQEEPQNQGAWYSCQHRFQTCLLSEQTLRYVGRAASAAPAAGYSSLHQAQQAALIKDALIPCAVAL